MTEEKKFTANLEDGNQDNNKQKMKEKNINRDPGRGPSP